MLSKDLKITIVIIASLIIIILVGYFVFRQFKHKSKQNYVPPSQWHPYGVGNINTNMANFEQVGGKLTTSTQEKSDLLSWWLSWKRDVPPETMNAIYALCPDIQDENSIGFYGLANTMASMLKELKPVISKINKSELSNYDNIKKYFNKCIVRGIRNIGNTVTGIDPKDWKEFNYVL